jgi:hypothetical protein
MDLLSIEIDRGNFSPLSFLTVEEIKGRMAEGSKMSVELYRGAKVTIKKCKHKFDLFKGLNGGAQ